MSNTFQINGQTFRYAREVFNEAWSNERSVEVALGRWFLDRYPDAVEVGAVMPYYGRAAHRVYDLCDEHPASIKANALDLDYTGQSVLSISTLEHMHRAEYANGNDDDGVTCLKKILTSASRYCITFPTQYNAALTHFLSTTPSVPRLILRRVNWKNEYVKHHDSNDFSIPFGHSDRPIPSGWWNNANGVVVITNLPELL